MHAPSQHLAKNIRQIREMRALSQEQAAKLCGIPRPTWSNLESGGANPTLSVLLRVAGALQVSVEELIGTPKAECRLYRASDLRTAKRGDAVVRKLLPDALPGLEFDRMELKPGVQMTGIPHRTGTREYLTCEKGKIRLTLGGESWFLEEGDVVVFRGDQKHSYRNEGSTTCVGYSVVVLSPA